MGFKVVIQGDQNYFAELALGNIPNKEAVVKFGHAPAGLQTTVTDVWDRADATPTQQIWVAPTEARIHAIVSSSTADDAAGTGAVSVTIWGLTAWDTAEVSETVVLDGTTPVNTVNSYVIIHRMKANAQATTTSPGINAGTIIATAATDTSITAAILPNNGQTEMAILGIPSTHYALIFGWHGQIAKASGAVATVDFVLRVNENPATQLLAFAAKDDVSVQSTGSSDNNRRIAPPLYIAGAAIIKIQGLASSADIDGKAGFDLEVGLLPT